MAQLRLISRALRRLTQVDGHRRGLVIQASLWLLTARIALIVVPFSTIARRLGNFMPPKEARVVAERLTHTSNDAQLAVEIGWAVTRAARYVPFKAVCLPQAMAARIMLARRGVASVLHFGARKGEAKLDAHAWLDAAGVEVTGFPVAQDFAELACFI